MAIIGWQEAALFAAALYIAFRIGCVVGRNRRDKRDLSQPPATAGLRASPASLPRETRTAIEAALADGRKIDAIRMLREATGMGLKDSKEAVEAMERR